MPTDKPTAFYLGVVEQDASQPPTLPPLRLFVVHRALPYEVESGRALHSDRVDVVVHAHGLDTHDGCLEFFVLAMETSDGQWVAVQYTRRVFKEWVDVEEINTGPQPKTVN